MTDTTNVVALRDVASQVLAAFQGYGSDQETPDIRRRRLDLLQRLQAAVYTTPKTQASTALRAALAPLLAVLDVHDGDPLLRAAAEPADVVWGANGTHGGLAKLTLADVRKIGNVMREESRG